MQMSFSNISKELEQYDSVSEDPKRYYRFCKFY